MKSLFLLATVLSVIGITDSQTALIVGFVLPFDRVLDMARTVVNITGDATVSVLVAKSENELDESIFLDDAKTAKKTNKNIFIAIGDGKFNEENEDWWKQYGNQKTTFAIPINLLKHLLQKHL